MKLSRSQKTTLILTLATACVVVLAATQNVLAVAAACGVCLFACGYFYRQLIHQEKELEQLRTALTKHDEAHKQWVADTSHELRTPIAILRAQVEALQDGVHAPNAKTLGVLHNEILMMSKLVDDLHDLAKSDVGQLKFDLAPVELSSVLDDALDAFDERLQAKGISLSRECCGESPVITADSRRLMQLLNNLLENSLRYTYEGGTVKVSTVCSGAHVTITVDDSKPSVRSELLGQIFERFSRGEISRNRQSGGTGLGLAICKTIAEAHGGTIAASHSPLGGLRVEVTLPVERSVVHV